MNFFLAVVVGVGSVLGGCGGQRDGSEDGDGAEIRGGGGVRVEPYRLDDSLLWRKVVPEEPVCGEKMPLDGPALSEGQLALLAAWIEGGAPR